MYESFVTERLLFMGEKESEKEREREKEKGRERKCLTNKSLYRRVVAPDQTLKLNAEFYAVLVQSTD